MVVWCCCCYWRADSKTSVLYEGILRKGKCFGGFPQFVLPGKMIQENRISHPDWVKICVNPNGRIKLRAKQKYEILSAIGSLTASSLFSGLGSSLLCRSYRLPLNLPICRSILPYPWLQLHCLCLLVIL